MPPVEPVGTEPVGARVAYVLKRYPRYSETFVVNEILAHEAAGLNLEIVSLNPPLDSHFQDAIARVRAPVHYLSSREPKGRELWAALGAAAELEPALWPELAAASGASAKELLHALELFVLLRQRGLSHLHAHFATSAATVARLAARFAGASYSLTAHAKDIFHESVDPGDLGRKLQDASRVVTVSDYNLRYLRERFPGVAATRIYNGLDLERFTYSSPAERPGRIVAVGRLVEKKGFAVLLSACALLKAEGTPFECLIVGTGEEEARLRAQHAALELGEQVRFLGPRPQAELREIVQGAAALAAPCVVGSDNNQDGLPTVLFEGMALGTPCVSTDVTGIPEIVVDGVSGLQVRQHDAPALAAALAQLLGDATLRVRLAETARRHIEADFDVRSNAARLRELFPGQREPMAQDEWTRAGLAGAA